MVFSDWVEDQDVQHEIFGNSFIIIISMHVIIPLLLFYVKVLNYLRLIAMNKWEQFSIKFNICRRKPPPPEVNPWGEPINPKKPPPPPKKNFCSY
jgi:hypothetical protein